MNDRSILNYRLNQVHNAHNYFMVRARRSIYQLFLWDIGTPHNIIMRTILCNRLRLKKKIVLFKLQSYKQL